MDVWFLCLRKPHGKYRAPAHFTAHGEIPSHPSREIPTDREAEARTLSLTGIAVHLHEGLEDRVELIGRNADPRVDHVDEYVLIRRRAAHVHAAALRRVADRVG